MTGLYDTRTERYSHLAELTEDEIKLVMFTADIIWNGIQRGRDEGLDPKKMFLPKGTERR